MIEHTACAPRSPTQYAQFDGIAVGEARVMDYGKAKSCVTQLRALKDGRKWSLLPAPGGNSKFQYQIVRLA